MIVLLASDDVTVLVGPIDSLFIRHEIAQRVILLAIFEGVHLLAYHVRIRANGSREKFRLLEDRQPNLPEIVGLENFARRSLKPVPERGIGRPDIARTLDGAELSLLCHFLRDRRPKVIRTY